MNDIRKPRLVDRALNAIEVVGNKLPDPAVLFLIMLLLTWFASWWLAGSAFDVVDPRSGEALQVNNLMAGDALAQYLTQMVSIFVNFAPLGIVLVALLGIGVAEHTGLVNAALRWMLGFTARWLLTPMVILIGIVSHTAIDAGYVLVIPLGGVIFYAAGRHPLAGIAAAFAGVSGGFSANFVPSGARSGDASGHAATASRISAPSIATPAAARPRRSTGASGSSFGMSCMSPSTGVSRFRRGSMTLSVRNQPIAVRNTLEIVVKK